MANPAVGRMLDFSGFLSVDVSVAAAIGVRVPVDFPALHDKPHPLQNGNILQWVSRNSDNVREVAGFKSADLSLPSKQFRAVQGAGLDRGQRGHPVFHHQFELARLSSM